MALLLFAITSLLALSAKAEIKSHVSCERDYYKMGCFKEFHDPTTHSLLITDKDDQSESYQGFELDWDKMKESIHSIACRCSKKSKEEGYDFFYIIHWAECWSSKKLNVINDIGKQSQRSSKCFNANFLECDDKHPEECVGGSEEKTNAVYLYKVSSSSQSTDVAIDGGLSEWSEFSECSATCGDGIKERERTCTNPVPQGSGKGCSGELSEAVKCNLAKCKDFTSENQLVKLNEAFLMEKEIPISKGNLVATFERLNKEYSVSFEVKPTAFQSGWKSVIHLTIGENILNYGDRNPGVWFHQSGAGNLHICSAVSGNRNLCKDTIAVELAKWSTFKISQEFIEGRYMYTIEHNGQKIFKEENNDARDFLNVKVYVSDPWYDVQPGFIRNLKITNGNPGTLVKDIETKLEAGKLLAVLPVLENQFKVSFDVKPNSFAVGWRNVIHFTIGSDITTYGDRVPGVWFHHSGNGGLHIAAPINGNLNRYFDTNPIPLNQWTHIEVSQQLQANSYIYKIMLNNVEVFSENNLQPKSFKNVKVFCSDPWYPVQDGSIKNLVVVNGNMNTPLSNDAIMWPSVGLISKPKEMKLEQGQLIGTMSLLKKVYTVSFKIKPVTYSKEWRSVIHLTTDQNYGKYGERNPAVWFHEGGSGRLAVFTALNENNNAYFPTDVFPLNIWSSVKIHQYQIKDIFYFSVDVNGKNIHTVENKKPIELKNVKVYASDPWYNAQDGFIKDILIFNGNSDQIINDEETPLNKGKLLAVVPKLGKEFSVSFDVKPNSFAAEWRNVIHFTIGSNIGNYGDRVPGVWFHQNGNGGLHIAAPINGNANRYFDTKPLALNEWTNVEISQKLEESVYIYIIKINGESVFAEENTQPKSFEDVKVYASDPWYPVQDGSIKDFYFINAANDLLPSQNPQILRREQISYIETPLVKGNLIAVIPKLDKEFIVSFDVKPNSFDVGWKSVIHFTIGSDVSRYGDRVPGVWFHYSGNGGLHIAAPINGNVNRYFDTAPIALKQWTNVEIRQHLEGNAYVYTIKLNGEIVFTEKNNDARSFEDVKVYASDPWYPVQDGSIRDFYVLNQNNDLLLSQNSHVLRKEQISYIETPLVKGNLLAVIPKLDKEFIVSFDVKPNSFNVGWKSVIHFTIGSDVSRYGDRVPGVWFHHSGNGGLHIAAPINGNINRYFDTAPIALKQWTNVEIRQRLEGNAYIYTIKLNGEVVFTEKNNDARSFEDVKVYASDPWYPVQDGSIRDFYVLNQNNDLLLSQNSLILRKEQVSYFETALVKGSLIAVIPKLDKEFIVSFDVKPNSFDVGWKSVIHFTIGSDVSRYGDRVPGVWFHQNGNGGLHIAAPINGNINRYFDTAPLALKQWTKVEIRQHLEGNTYIYTIKLNGEVVFTEKNNDARSFEDVKVYASDPWYPVQDGSIRDFYVLNQNNDFLFSQNSNILRREIISYIERPLAKGSLLAVIPKLDKEYFVSFDVKPNSFSAGYKNIIHFTIGSDVTRYGDRVPGVWSHHSGNGGLHIAAAINGNVNRYFDTAPIALKQWTNVEIRQHLEGNAYIYTIKLNGEIVFTEKNNDARSFEDVKVYASDPWYPVQDGFIKNFYILNQNDDVMNNEIESSCKMISPNERTDCGWPGISESECNKRSCCFDSSIPNVNWCFFSSNLVSNIYSFESYNYPQYQIGIRDDKTAAIILNSNEGYRIVKALNGQADAVSFQSAKNSKMYLRHQNAILHLHPIESSSELFKNDASFIIREDKYYTGYVSFESTNYPGFFLRHQGYTLKLHKDDPNTELYRKDASFKLKKL
ncbi:uncharacterized protein LOC100198704 isoform X2 [Hydra vulgaris]|uniref:uncharacterized protein LOC100198704 isoform X2 n=1 Tax=Hydra vulgaris TaxID=6087 RepID=UPI001F5F729F|nr:uncharacterized protein LOC100198704 isoform X2 [Hydra vulgaris]